MMKLTPLLLICSALAACGGSGSDAPAPAPTPPGQPAPAATITVASPTTRTIGGGSAIPLTARLSTAGTVSWQLAAGAPGSLSATTGASVRYLPPPAALLAPLSVTVTASGDGASVAQTLQLTPEPGAAGLYLLPWRTETAPTMWRPVDVAADVAGNVYALLETDASPSRRGTPHLVKIAPGGAITALIDASTWFAKPASAENAQRLYFTSGFAADRVGNLYFATPGGAGFGIELGQQASIGPAILKVTPAGDMSVLAGLEGAQTGALTDGAGAAARFLNPAIVGVDADDNLYVLDRNDVKRKVTPAGVVSTIGAFPASLGADMNGNTYRFDATRQLLLRTSADGVVSPETTAPTCAGTVPTAPRTCLGAGTLKVVPIGGASYVIVGPQGLSRLVLPH